MSVRHVRVHGRKVWQARVAFRGLRTSTIRDSKEGAKDAEGELRRQLQEQAAQVESQLQAPATVKTLFEAYALDLEARGKGEETVKRATQTGVVFQALLPELHAGPVSKLGAADLFSFRALRLAKKAKPATINRDLRVIRAMLKKASPDFRFPKDLFFKENETRVRWLGPDEELLVLGTMPSPFREMATLAALTLMRLSEIRLLQREQVRLEQGVILLPQTKTEPRPVVLSDAAQKILRQQLEAHTRDWVFPNPDGRPWSRHYVGAVFRRAARGAGLKDFHFHDLRHHGATMALNKGFTAPIVMALGGWKTERMMRRYAAVTDSTLRAAAEAVSGNGGWQPAPKFAPVQATG